MRERILAMLPIRVDPNCPGARTCPDAARRSLLDPALDLGDFQTRLIPSGEVDQSLAKRLIVLDWQSGRLVRLSELRQVRKAYKPAKQMSQRIPPHLKSRSR